MKILITGANGQLGHALYWRLLNKAELFLTDKGEAFFDSSNKNYASVDITLSSEVKKIVQKFQPDYVINCAAFTNVDACEREKELSWKVNVKAVEHLAYLSRIYHFHLIHFSTDYIFDGEKGLYDVDDRPNPINYYGKGKLASENFVKAQAEAFTIVRTNVLFDFYPNLKNNFVTWVIRNLAQNKAINVVIDQFNNPTYAKDLAVMIDSILERGIQGIYHSGSREYLNRYEIAKLIAEIGEFDSNLIHPIQTSELNQLAKRPLKGGLNIYKSIQDLKYSPLPLKLAIKSIIRDMKSRSEI